MKIRASVLTLLSCCLVWAIAAVAQEQSGVPVAGKITLGVSVEETALVASGWRASKLLHAPVYNEKDQKIDDFIVSSDGTLSVARARMLTM
jgi:hypothetical protein